MEARFQGPGEEPVDLPQGAFPAALSPLPESSIVLLFSSNELQPGPTAVCVPGSSPSDPFPISFLCPRPGSTASCVPVRGDLGQELSRACPRSAILPKPRCVGRTKQPDIFPPSDRHQYSWRVHRGPWPLFDVLGACGCLVTVTNRQ